MKRLFVNEFPLFCAIIVVILTNTIDNTQDRKMKKKMPSFYLIFSFWVHEQQEMIEIQIFISFAGLHLTVLTTVKRT